MNLRIRKISLFLLAGACVAGSVIACSGSDDSREAFSTDETDASSPPVAVLPDATSEATDHDGDGSEADAGITDKRPPFDPAEEAVICAVTPCANQIVAGENHFCARMSDGTVRCWGDNAKGNLGVEDAGVLVRDGGVSDGGPDSGTGYPIPTVTGIADATQISAGGTTTCALVSDGGVDCWGGNDKAQLGRQSLDAGATATSDTLAHPAPAPVGLASGATRVDVGLRSACAVLFTGQVWCWGDNSQLELARTLPATIGAPAKAEFGTFNVIRTSIGTNTGFGVTDSGALLQWGSTMDAAAGRISSLSPDAIPYALLPGPVTSFSVSSTTSSRSHACAIVKGQVYCWGASQYGAMGTGLPTSAPTPTLAVVKSETGWPQQVAAAGDLTCLRLTDGTVQCAGDNTRGALGKDTKALYSMMFTEADLFKGHAVQIAASTKTVCALVQGGSVVCWGSNEKGELGQGSTDTNPHPTPVLVGF